MNLSAVSEIRSSRRSQWQIVVLSMQVGLALFGVLWLVSACGRGTGEQLDPYAPYRSAVKSGYQDDFAAMGQAPRYAIDVTLDSSLEVLTGTVQVDVTNYSEDSWRYLIFRLYPVLVQYGGTMRIQSVLIDDQSTTYVYQADNTALRIDLSQPLEPGDQVSVAMNWQLGIPSWLDSSNVYALFGNSQRMTSLPLFYPTLAVYEPGPTLGTGHWWLKQGSVRGDSAFNVASLFVVTATLPSEQIPVTSGTLVSTSELSSTVPGGQTRYVWVTGPSREFVLHLSPAFQSASTEAYGTQITSYWLPGQEAAGRAALTYAVGALRLYSDLFGEYPFRDMSVAPAPLSFRGMEYPQVNLLGVELYDRYKGDLEVLVAHEVAHQWWYQIVHNDPVDRPWLDEGLAEYSVKLYYEALHGDDDAAFLGQQRWQMPFNLLVDDEGDAPLDQPVDSFTTSSQYETVVYGKGALLYERLHRVLGDRHFKQFMRDYLERYRYEIVDTADWWAAVQDLDNPELRDLYQDWVAVPDSQLPQQAEEPVGSDGENAQGDSF